MSKLLKSTAIIAAVLAAAPAAATTWQYDSKNNVGAYSKTKDVFDSTYIYQDSTERFKMTFDVSTSAGVDGFWVVINDGPMPVGGVEGQYAILYSDLNDIWAYQYKGSGNNNGSYNTGPVLEKWENAVSSSTNGDLTTYSMLLDVAGLNSIADDALDGLEGDQKNWKGLRLDDVIGTWLHPTINTFANCGGSYETNGDLTCFSSNNWIGWDETNKQTTRVSDSVLPPVVPLPAGLPLLIAGLGAFGVARRFKQG
ncbi:MAG: VPLPA-CTERM sorting domain-containing protein [Litoreibacter sp.]|nr:VPLPA-CTERM sorting domain-containing protein [Litoreibacter sp.]MCY4334644.1 VPLPA-CTERM sorting domain-containing protein [Litoreibacter sp.]